MKVISLWQPWATLWAGGAKKIETRSWALRCPLPAVFAVHAAKRLTSAEQQVCSQEPFRSALAALGYEKAGDLPLGGVVGVVRVVRQFRVATRADVPPAPEQQFGDYAGGRWGWVTDGNKLLAEPIPLRGQQGIWEFPMPAGVRYVERAVPLPAAPAGPVEPTLFDTRDPRKAWR